MNPPVEPSPFSQHQYQVRFEWGAEGARAIGEGADVVVWVDALATAGSAAADPTEADPTAADPTAADAAAIPDDSTPGLVVTGSLRNRRAVAEWVLEQQGQRGDRFVVAVVAAGERWGEGSIRFAIEDLLAAGAVIDALAEVGIDYCSPEAATASAAFTGLRHATGHLVSAGSSGRLLAHEGRLDEVERAIELDSSREITVRSRENAVARN